MIIDAKGRYGRRLLLGVVPHTGEQDNKAMVRQAWNWAPKKARSLSVELTDRKKIGQKFELTLWATYYSRRNEGLFTR